MTKKMRPYIGVHVHLSTDFQPEEETKEKLIKRIRDYLKGGGFLSNSVAISPMNIPKEETQVVCYLNGKIHPTMARAIAKRLAEDVVRAYDFAPIYCIVRYGSKIMASFTKRTNNFKKRL